MFRRMSTSNAPTSALDLFTDFRRGHGDADLPAVEWWPSAEALAESQALSFEPQQNEAGKIFLGTIGSPMETDFDPSTGNTRYYAVGGKLLGLVDDRHVFLMAGTRSGKGRGLLTPTLLTFRAGMTVIDLKGDMARTTARFRKEIMRQRVVVLDPFNVAGHDAQAIGGGVGFNPMEGVDPDDDDAVVELAGLIADALIVRQANEKDPHWSESAAAAVEAVVAHVLTWPLHEHERNLVTVMRLLGRGISRPEPGIPSDLEASMRSNPAAGGLVEEGAATIFDRPDKEAATVASTIHRNFRWLQYPAMQRLVSSGGVSMVEALREPTTTYVCIPLTKQTLCAGFQRLVVSQLIAAGERSESRVAHQEQRGGPQHLLICDEFPQMGRFDILLSGAAAAAGLGIKIYFIAQDLSQLQATYTDSWQTFLANSGTVILFGVTDNATLQWAESRLGKTTVVHQSQSDGSYKSLVHDGASGRSASQQLHPLLTSAEIARFFNRDDPLSRQLVFTASYGPVVMQRIAYDKHPVFRGLLAKARG